MARHVVNLQNAKIKRPPKLNVLAVFCIGVTGFEPFARQTGGHLGPEGPDGLFFVYLQGFPGISARIRMVNKHFLQAYLRVFRSRIS